MLFIREVSALFDGVLNRFRGGIPGQLTWYAGSIASSGRLCYHTLTRKSEQGKSINDIPQILLSIEPRARRPLA